MALGRFLRFFTKIHDKELTSIKCGVVLFKIARTGLSKSEMELKLFFKIMESLASPGLLEQCLLRRACKMARDCRGTKKLPTLVSVAGFKSECKRLFDKGDIAWVVALHALLACGRRRRDLSRVESSRITKVGSSSYFFTIPHDKKNDHPITFSMDFAEIPENWAFLSTAQLVSFIDNLTESQSKPFSMLNSSSASRFIGFRCHSLRNVKTLQLTLNEKSDTQIMDVIGWRDPRSVGRYRILTRAEVLMLGSLERVIEEINERACVV